MIVEKSYGAIVFSNDNKGLQYVIIESKDGVFGFPKGHIEENESELEAAQREVFEETGLLVNFLDNFREEINYSFNRGDETRIKNVVYFLAEYSNQIPIAQESELNGICIMNYEAALSSLQFENLRRILTKAHNHILNY